MAQDEEDLPASAAEGDPAELPERPRRRRRRKAAGALVAILLLALTFAWLTRERIADDVISGQLEALGLPATYEIVSIGPRRQVLKNIVVGDPSHPDLTVARAELSVSLGWGTPGIGRLVLVEPRLYGAYRKGRLSFGSLDPLIFTDSKAPFRLPDLDLRIVDGRGLLDSDWGPVGFKVDGGGQLRGGFAGELAAVAPRVAVGGCTARKASLYGSVRITGEKPRFAGPLRLAALDCPARGLTLAAAGVQLDATADQPLDGVEGKLGLRTGAAALGADRMASLGGTLRFTFRKQALTARYDLAGHDIQTPQAAAASLRLAGVVRGVAGLARWETEGELAGAGLRPGKGFDAALADAQQAGDGTLAAPLLGRMRAALLRQGQDSRLAGSFVLRRAGGTFNLVVPQAALRSGGGETLVSLSRFQITADGRTAPRLAGNFAMSGEGLPQIAGRLERAPGGRMAMRMAMAEYRAGDARLAVPRLTLVQLANGALGFTGEARLSGPLPGGRAENLVLPLDGNWSAAAGLSAWRACTPLRFDRLALASLVIERRALSLCPPKGGAIVRSDARGTRIAAGAPSLDLAGRLGATPIRIRSGALGIAVPGTLTARALDVTLGPAATASHFRIADLDARIGSEVAGHFSGSDVLLAAVPLDLRDAGGDWRFAGGRLTLSNGSFRLEDRQVDDRFQPLVARGASLVLVDNMITADALLREPRSDREVVRTAIRHDLASGNGSADLAVDGIVFDDKLQPDTVSRLALGVVANASGTIRGSGRIAWDAKTVTSTGRFSTDSFDFAAAFGPVKGASGTVVFTDLLGLVTAPDQQLHIASINPGIEVNDGVVTFALQPNNVLAVKGGSWPFLDGRLTLRPVTMNIGVAETRRYVLVIEGLNAARFVERMELANISATGTFDGALPLVFDQNGGRIEGGLLTAPPPGGNVSYVGALTYEDLSTMANFAFDALKSLDYREMSIGMDGALEGEIVTRVRFRGIRQGAAAKRNFLTDRIARLPIQFNVNLRAPFLSLISSFKSLYDPAYVRDPRELGLMDAQGRPLAPPPAAAVPIQP
jgi:hypothetical protein